MMKQTPIKTDSSTDTSNIKWTRVAREVRGEIMKTDIYCEIQCSMHEAVFAQELISEALQRFRNFANEYSRFRTHNALWTLNENSTTRVSPELFTLLEQAVAWNQVTQGYFDPCLLTSLEQAGYQGVYTSEDSSSSVSVSDLSLDRASLTVTKPQALKIDLGGIGKGFIVDRVTELFAQHFQNFLIDAGGDIRVRGTNRIGNYAFWAIDIEHPVDTQKTLATLLLKDQAVATSGKNRRHWNVNGETHHHLIDPQTRRSAESDFVSVTVIAPDTTTADIWAKTLFLAGKQKAAQLAATHAIPFFAVDNDQNISMNSLMKTYVWSE